MLRVLARWGGRLDAALSFVEVAFVGAAMAFCSLLLFANVALRYIFLAPISWAEEITIYTIVWVVFIGASVIVRMRGHLAIDLLPRAIPRQSQVVLSGAVLVLCLLFFATFTYFSSVHTLRVFDTGQVTPNLQAPMWLAYLAMPCGTALMFLRTSQLLWRTIIDGAAGGMAKPAYE